jgi:hypothetical protein
MIKYDTKSYMYDTTYDTNVLLYVRLFVHILIPLDLCYLVDMLAMQVLIYFKHERRLLTFTRMNDIITSAG